MQIVPRGTFFVLTSKLNGLYLQLFIPAVSFRVPRAHLLGLLCDQVFPIPKMSNNDRVTHSTRGYTMKFGQVQKRIAENSCFVWVVYGESFRDATIAEAAQMRKEQAAQPNHALVYYVEGKAGKLIAKTYFAELPGLIFKPAQKDQALTRQGFMLIKQANQLAYASR